MDYSILVIKVGIKMLRVYFFEENKGGCNNINNI
jgi:hypothetical protein